MEGFLFVRFTSQNDPRVRNAQGRYVSAQRLLAHSNQTAAREIQALVVRYIHNNLKRPGVSTDRLVHVTASAENAKSVPGGWARGYGVGNEEFLDHSVSKYWRTIEEGTEVAWGAGRFTSLELKGIWGASISGLGTDKWGSRAFGGPDFTLSGQGGHGGKFVPISNIGAARKLLGKGSGRIKKIKAVHPHHEIQGQFAYTKAWHDYDGGARVRKDLHALLAAIGGQANYAAVSEDGPHAYAGHFHGFSG